MSRKISPRRLSHSMSPKRSEKHDSDSASPYEKNKKDKKTRSKSSNARLTTEPKSVSKYVKSPVKGKYTSDFEESPSDYQKPGPSGPKGATSDTEEDEALIRSTDVHPESRSIKEHLSDLNSKSPMGYDSSDSGTDMKPRSSGGNKWTYEKIKILCVIWEEEDHLYNPTHPQYLNKKLRTKAHNRMAAALNMSGKPTFEN